ncbi:mCG1030059, partial [Mus musculus]
MCEFSEPGLTLAKRTWKCFSHHNLCFYSLASVTKSFPESPRCGYQQQQHVTPLPYSYTSSLDLN